MSLVQSVLGLLSSKIDLIYTHAHEDILLVAVQLLVLVELLN